MDPLSTLLNPVSIDWKAVDPATDSVLSLQNNNIGYTLISQRVSRMES